MKLILCFSVAVFNNSTQLISDDVQNIMANNISLDWSAYSLYTKDGHWL